MSRALFVSACAGWGNFRSGEFHAPNRDFALSSNRPQLGHAARRSLSVSDGGRTTMAELRTAPIASASNQSRVALAVRLL